MSDLIDERLKCLLILLFMYAFYFLSQNEILSFFINFFSNRILRFYATNTYLFLSLFFGLHDSLS